MYHILHDTLHIQYNVWYHLYNIYIILYHDKWINEEDLTILMCMHLYQRFKVNEAKTIELKRKTEKSTIAIGDLNSFLDYL